LLGIPEQCVHRLERVRSEADNAVLVVWSLVKETRDLLKMSNQIRQGQTIAAVMQQNRVWSNRQRFVSSALNRLDQAKILELMKNLLHIEAVAKGQAKGNIWHELEKICLRYCGIETSPKLLNN